MAWGGWRIRRDRAGAYPLLVLLVVALLAGCGDAARRPAPRFYPPGTPATTGGDPAPTSAGVPSGSTAATPEPSPAPTRTLRYAFPVRGSASYHPTHAAYPGTDIFAACGTPVVAVTDGRILEVSRVDRYAKSGPQGPHNGGRSVSLLGDDGVRYYGSHLMEVSAGIEADVRVRAGQRLGAVGRTGNANNVCHLHFGISPPCAGTGDWWIRRGVVWPAPFLDSWRKTTNRSPVDAVTTWHRKRGCPKKP